MIKAYAAMSAGAQLEAFEYDPGLLANDEVEIAVESCGICHSDLSMLDNDWGITQYPFVPGHEVIGTVIAIGEAVTSTKIGDRVGLGWHAAIAIPAQRASRAIKTSVTTLSRLLPAAMVVLPTRFARKQLPW